MSVASPEVVEDKGGSQQQQEIQNNSSQHNIPLEKRGAASVDNLESSEMQMNKEIEKRRSSTPEIIVSQSDAPRKNKNISDVQLKEKKLKGNQKSVKSNAETITSISQEKEALSEDESHTNDSVIHSILSEVLTHMPSGGSDYETTADSVVHNILSDMLAQVSPDEINIAHEIKSGELIARSALSEVLSHLSSEVAAHKVSLDCEYLKEKLGAPLALGLCEITLKRPADPIHYLAHWLFKWRWSHQQKQIKEQEISELNLQRQKKLAELKEKERLEAEQQALLELKKQANDAALSTLDTALNRAFEVISHIEEGETAAETEEGSIESVQH